MSTINTIQDFLVSLGFGVDEESAKSAQAQIQKFETRVQGLAVAVYGALSMVANDFEKLYYQTKRIGASSENVRGFSSTIDNMGGSAEGALSSLENLAQKMRQMPGYEGMLNNLGVNTKDGNGQIRDRVEVLKDLSKTLSGMEYYQANAYGQALGIDESTLMAMRDKDFVANLEKQQKLQKELGMNDSLTAESKDFAQQNRQLWMSIKTISNVALAQMGRGLLPMLKQLNGLLAENAPQIKAVIEKYGKGAGLVLAFVAALITIKRAAAVITMLGNLLSVLRLLRLAFLATPLGIIAALGMALVALYQDYQTWKDGGKSLIDWENWQAEVEMAKALLDGLGKVFDWLGGKAREFWKVVGGGAWLESIGKKVQQATIDAKPVIDATAREVTQAVQGATDNLIVTDKIKGFTPEKAETIKRVAGNIGADPNDLATAISFETGGSFDPKKRNPKSSATGLIQFMEYTDGKAGDGKYWGKTRDEFGALSFDEQMQYVERYFKDRGFRADKPRTIADVYGAITGYGYSKFSKSKASRDAYNLNKVWDANGNGIIEKGEMVLNPKFKEHQREYFKTVAPPTGPEVYGRQYGEQQPASQQNVNNAPVSVTQHNNVTVYADNPQEAGREVGKAQRQANVELALAARNTKSPIM